MKTIETQITIDAPSSIVWEILINHKAYSSWNPFIHSIQGTIQEGQQLEVSLGAKGKKPMIFKPLVLVRNEEVEFRWLGHLFIKGLFDGEHYFKLEKKSNTQTTFIHGEKFTGALVGPILKMVGKDTIEGFEMMNESLKIQSENKAQYEH